MIAGVSVEAGREAVVLVSERPLRVLSSAVHQGGFVNAATGRGAAERFGGPACPLGWVAARAVRAALDRSIRDWQERHR